MRVEFSTSATLSNWIKISNDGENHEMKTLDRVESVKFLSDFDRKERKWNKEAQPAEQAALDKLRSLPGGGAWDESQPRDLNRLLREAKAQGRTSHWGHAFSYLCREE